MKDNVSNKLKVTVRCDISVSFYSYKFTFFPRIFTYYDRPYFFKMSWLPNLLINCPGWTILLGHFHNLRYPDCFKSNIPVSFASM